MLLVLFEKHRTRFAQVTIHSKAQDGVSVSTSLFKKKITWFHQADLIFRENFHVFVKQAGFTANYIYFILLTYLIHKVSEETLFFMMLFHSTLRFNSPLPPRSKLPVCLLFIQS